MSSAPLPSPQASACCLAQGRRAQRAQPPRQSSSDRRTLRASREMQPGLWARGEASRPAGTGLGQRRERRQRRRRQGMGRRHRRPERRAPRASPEAKGTGVSVTRASRWVGTRDGCCSVVLITRRVWRSPHQNLLAGRLGERDEKVQRHCEILLRKSDRTGDMRVRSSGVCRGVPRAHG